MPECMQALKNCDFQNSCEIKSGSQKVATMISTFKLSATGIKL